MSRRARPQPPPARPPQAASVDSAPSPSAALRATAAVLVAGAIGWSEGLYDPLALALVTAATALVAAAAWVRGTHRLARSAPAIVLASGVAGGLAFDALFLPGILVDPARLGPFRPVLAVVAALAAAQLWPRPPPAVRLLRLPLLVVAWLALAAVVVRASPAPGIDVWRLQQAGALALADGHNPYAVAYPNPYGPGTPILAPELLSPDGRFIRGFPYPPLSLLTGLPAALAGDVRIALVLATALAALLVWQLGRRERLAELAATFVLVQPRTLMVVELAWTEPLVLAAVAGLALVAARAAAGRSSRPGSGALALGIAGGLAVASKQYGLLAALPVAAIAPRALWLRAALAAAAVMVVLHLPFLLWDPSALWRGLVRYQIAQPFRPDALSWLAAIVAWGGPELSPWPAFPLAFGAAFLAGRRARGVADALGAGALGWLVLVLGNKQAFANYYWLAVGILCASVAAEARTARSGDAP